MNRLAYHLFIHRMSLNKKVLTDIDEAERLADKSHGYWDFEGSFGSMTELNDYYREWFR